MEFLRQARLEDRDEVNRLARQLRSFHDQWWGLSLEHDRYSEEDFAGAVESGYIYVAESDGNIVGYLYAFMTLEIDFDDEEYKVADISSLCVDEAFRGSGFGKRMMQEYLEYAKQQGCKNVKLDVIKENIRALSMYQQFGFKVTGYSMQLNL